jgi:hypothetical protein
MELVKLLLLICVMGHIKRKEYYEQCIFITKLLQKKTDHLQWVEINPSNIRIFPMDIRFLPPHGTMLKALILILADVR